VKVLLCIPLIFFGLFVLAVELILIRTADPFEPNILGWIMIVGPSVGAIGAILLGAYLIFKQPFKK
jgi:hypothetical protein